MNATEQRAHRSVTQSLQAQIDDLTEVTVALDNRVLTLSEAARGQRGELARHAATFKEVSQKLELKADKQTTSAELRGLSDCIVHLNRWTDPLRRGFWGRLRWLVTGR